MDVYAYMHLKWIINVYVLNMYCINAYVIAYVK